MAADAATSQRAALRSVSISPAGDPPGVCSPVASATAAPPPCLVPAFVVQIAYNMTAHSVIAGRTVLVMNDPRTAPAGEPERSHAERVKQHMRAAAMATRWHRAPDGVAMGTHWIGLIVLLCAAAATTPPTSGAGGWPGAVARTLAELPRRTVGGARDPHAWESTRQRTGNKPVAMMTI